MTLIVNPAMGDTILMELLVPFANRFSLDASLVPTVQSAFCVPLRPIWTQSPSSVLIARCWYQGANNATMQAIVLNVMIIFTM